MKLKQDGILQQCITDFPFFFAIDTFKLKVRIDAAEICQLPVPNSWFRTRYFPQDMVETKNRVTEEMNIERAFLMRSETRLQIYDNVVLYLLDV